MPDIYDPERGLKIVLTDDDYDDYQKVIYQVISMQDGQTAL